MTNPVKVCLNKALTKNCQCNSDYHKYQLICNSHDHKNKRRHRNRNLLFFHIVYLSRQGEGRMADKKKMIFNIVFLILVFAGTLYGVFHGEDLGKIVHIVKTVNPLWLIPGVICVVIFIWGESIIIFYMMHTLGIKLKKWTCFLFSSVGFFFSCITPSPDKKYDEPGKGVP